MWKQGYQCIYMYMWMSLGMCMYARAVCLAAGLCASECITLYSINIVYRICLMLMYAGICCIQEDISPSLDQCSSHPPQC